MINSVLFPQWTSSLLLHNVRDNQQLFFVVPQEKEIELCFSFFPSIHPSIHPDLCSYTVIVFYDGDGTTAANLFSILHRAFKYLKKIGVSTYEYTILRQNPKCISHQKEEGGDRNGENN